MKQVSMKLIYWAAVISAVTFVSGASLAQEQPGKLQSIPGTLRAVSYDRGGEGAGFHLKQAAAAPKSYPIPAGGQAVELAEGDWLRYTAEVGKTGQYTMKFRVAHEVGDDPLFIVECDGHDVTGIMNAPYTGGLSNWVELSRPAVHLDAGRHQFTVKQVGGTPFYLESIAFAQGGEVKPGLRPNAKKWKLAWSDEFNYTGAPNPSKWDYDIGGDGWGNQELEYYTGRPENVRVEGGRLIIEARREDFKENHYTSARLVTRGKKQIKYGRLEVSAKLPAGEGTWPAIWLLGDNGKDWPGCGELDIMEHLGRNPGWIHGSAHSLKYFFKNGNQKTSITYVPHPEAGFHEYAIEWYPDHIDMYVDNNKYLTVTNDGTGWEAWPFGDPEYLILNIALGGWGGKVNDSQLPARMEVKYVRYYEQAEGATAGAKGK